MKTQLPRATSQLTEILFLLIENETIDFAKAYFYCGILNLMARISDLRLQHDLNIECKRVNAINKFGRKISYGRWSLPNKKLGIEVYNKLLKL